MKQKIIILVLLAVIVTMLISVLFTGCTSNNNSNNVADVKLEGFSHHETFELPAHYVSDLSFTLQNKGDAIAENVMLYISIVDNYGIEIYNKEITFNSALSPNEEIVQSIDLPYDLYDTQFDVGISVNWDGGTNQYTRSFEPEFKEYSDVVLESMTHHESYNSSKGYTASINLLFQNRGNLIAENVKIHVIARDDGGNENYNKEENLIPLLSPWEVQSYEITVPYDFDDTRLDLSITVIWDNGTNEYARSFEPEFKEFSDVQLDIMTHYEHYKLFVGYVSTANFIFQNKGSTEANNVDIHIIANDNYGNEVYNGEILLNHSLMPGEIKFHEITIPYDFDDTHLDISITVNWDGGSNNYSESYEPKIFF